MKTLLTILILFHASINANAQEFADQSLRCFDKKMLDVQSMSFNLHPIQDAYISDTELSNHIFAGALIGFVFGAGIGVFFQDFPYTSALKGGIIGASIFPILNYERVRKSKGLGRPDNCWQMVIGVNYTNSQYSSTAKPGMVLGFGRNYLIGKNTGLKAECSYTQRKFLLPNVIISYYYFQNPNRNTNIYFDYSYIDLAFMPNYTFRIRKVFAITLSAGPSIAVPIANNIEYVENPNLAAEDYDFSYSMDEPSPTFAYPALKAGIDISRKNFSLLLRYDHALRESHQIFPLYDERTMLSTFLILVGYNF